MQNSFNLSDKEHLWTSKKIDEKRFLRIQDIMKNGIIKKMYVFMLNATWKEWMLWTYFSMTAKKQMLLKIFYINSQITRLNLISHNTLSEIVLQSMNSYLKKTSDSSIIWSILIIGYGLTCKMESN